MVNYLTITTGALGTVLVEAQVIPATRNEVPIEVQVCALAVVDLVDQQQLPAISTTHNLEKVVLYNSIMI